jgi:hypothetical protein
MTRTEGTKRTPPSAEDRKKAAWKKASDRGPHTATLPSGTEVTFVIPDQTALVRADMLPDRLAEMAILAVSYPDGPEGYLSDLGVQAMSDPEKSAKLKDALKQGLELRDWLVSEMLVDPKLTPEEVGSGDFPPADIEMLVAFAERKKNVDAKGVKLPITVLETLAPFPSRRAVEEALEILEDGREPAAAAAPGADGE